MRFTHVVRVQNFSTKNRGSVSSADFCASHPKNFFRASLPVAEVDIPYSIFHYVDP